VESNAFLRRIFLGSHELSDRIKNDLELLVILAFEGGQPSSQIVVSLQHASQMNE